MYTITLNGNSTELSCDIYPPLEVEKSSRLCLLSLQTNNSIPNIEPGCNTIGFHDSNGNNEIITIPTGSYELDVLESTIQSLLPTGISWFRLSSNKNTLKCKISSSNDIDLTMSDSIAKLLGFNYDIIKSDTTFHESINPVNITKVNCIKVDCNLITGSLYNGIPSQTIHEFFPSVPAGYKIIELPRHLVFYPLHTTSISEVRISLKDQENNLINLRGETITVRLQITHGDQIRY